MANHAIVAIENPTEQDHGAIIHGMNQYAAGRGMTGTGGGLRHRIARKGRTMGETKRL
jgi:hypothetical protein